MYPKSPLCMFLYCTEINENKVRKKSKRSLIVDARLAAAGVKIKEKKTFLCPKKPTKYKYRQT